MGAFGTGGKVTDMWMKKGAVEEIDIRLILLNSS